MRIRAFNLLRYGKFTDRRVELPFAEKDIHIIVGPNEAGKSTLRTAIGDWLFGIPMRTPLAFMHPMPELRLGGVLERPAPANAIESLAFDRVKGTRNTLRGEDDAVLSEAMLQQWLGGLDAQTFSRMYALDHATLIEGGAGILSASDDLGRMLFQSASGIEHLGRVLQTLQKEADTLWAPRKSGSREYYIALDVFNGAHEQLKKSTLRTRDWMSRHQALRDCEQALNAARDEHVQLRDRIRRLERIRRVYPLLQTLDESQSGLQTLLATGPVPLLPVDADSILTQANRRLASAETNLQRYQQESDQLQAELDKLQVDHRFLSLAVDIQDLNERRLQFRAHRTDIIKRQEEIRLEWQRAQEKARSLGWDCSSIDALSRRVPAQSLRLRLRRLLKERDALLNQRQAADKDLALRHGDIASHTQRLQNIGACTVSTKLTLWVERAQALGDHEQAMADFNGRLQRLESELESALAELGAWRRPAETLLAMSVPDSAFIQNLLNEQRTDAAEAKSVRSNLAAKQLEHDRTRLELEQLLQRFQPVSQQQVADARDSRDLQWQRIKDAPQFLPELARDYEGLVDVADDLSDKRLEKLQYEVERESKTQRLLLLQQECESLQARLHTLQQQADDRNDQWQSLIDACGLPGLPPEVAPHWLTQRRKILELLRDKSDIECLKLAKIQAIEEARLGLWRELEPRAGVDSDCSLAECLRRTRDLINQANQASGQRQSLEQQLADANASLPVLHSARDSSIHAWQICENSWRDAVILAGYAHDTVPADRVEADLEVADDIERLLTKICSIQTERIDTMQADLDDLQRAAVALAEKLVPEIVDLPAESIAIELSNRLDAEQRTQQAMSDGQVRLKNLQKVLDDAKRSLADVNAQLAPLFTIADVEQIGALSEAVSRSDSRRALEKSLAQVNQDLKVAGDGLTMEQLRLEVQECDPQRMLSELDALNQQVEHTLEQIASLSDKHGALKAAFEALNGADLAAKAEAQKQEAVTQMADAVQRYLSLHTVARLLKWSMEKFRETRQGPMLLKASAMFNTLTLGSFSRLVVDTDGQVPRLFGVRPDGMQVDVSGMSQGSRDQLYLALRLAALDMHIEQGFNMPLIVDDLFINFDDSRTVAGLTVLGELSRGMQVVFLTHHDHLLPLARQVLGDDLNVVML